MEKFSYMSSTYPRHNSAKERLWEKIRDIKDENLQLMLIGDFNIDARKFDVLTQHFLHNAMIHRSCLDFKIPNEFGSKFSVPLLYSA